MRNDYLISICPFFKIHILFFPLLISSIVGNYYKSFIWAYASALLHEIGHIVSAKLLGVEISHIEILPFGICGKLKEPFIKSPDKEILIALSGPFVSFAIASSVFLANKYFAIPENIFNFIFPINLLLCMANLIPAVPLDGGRIIRASLTKRFGIIPAIKISNFLSLVLTSLLICLSIYGLLSYEFNFSLILISAFLLGSLCMEQKTVSKAILSELMTFRDKPSKNDFKNATVITAKESTPARKILKKLSYDRYHIVCVTDENLNVKRILTEGQVVWALTEKGIGVHLYEI